MKYAVSNDVLTKTTKCSHAFSCLATGKCGNVLMCKIEKRFDKNMLYIKTTSDIEGGSCPYLHSYGSKQGHICTCPTHYAIYEQYECVQTI